MTIILDVVPRKDPASIARWNDAISEYRSEIEGNTARMSRRASSGPDELTFTATAILGTSSAEVEFASIDGMPAMSFVALAEDTFTESNLEENLKAMSMTILVNWLATHTDIMPCD